MDNWANTKVKKQLYAKAEALGASIFVLSDFDAAEEFVNVKEKLLQG